MPSLPGVSVHAPDSYLVTHPEGPNHAEIDSCARAVVHHRTDQPSDLFGAFIEHMGRCVYTGIYEPDHSGADDDGFRTDVLNLVRELGVTVVRCPDPSFPMDQVSGLTGMAQSV